MASRRESRALDTISELNEELNIKNAKLTTANNRLAKKNNELLAQISLLNKQLQESVAEQYELKGTVTTLQRRAVSDHARMNAYERERQGILDYLAETTRANEWANRNLASLRRAFEKIETAVPPPSLGPSLVTDRSRPSLPSITGVSKPPDVSLIQERDSEEEEKAPSPSSTAPFLYPYPITTTTSRRSLYSTASAAHLALDSSADIPPSSLTSINVTTWSTPIPSSSSRTSSATATVSTPAPHSSSSRKSSRRQSGLIDPFDRPPRSTSPLPPPEELEAEDERAASSSRVGRTKEKSKRKALEKASNEELKPPGMTWGEGLNDVTNSPPPTVRKKKSSTSIAATITREEQDEMSEAGEMGRGRKTSRSTKEREKATDVYRSPRSLSPRPSPSSLDTPLAPVSSLSDQEGVTGRGGRVRKSVNYAEPKLNTKMRKPEGYDSKKPSSRRSSAATSSSNLLIAEAMVPLPPSSSVSPPPSVSPTALAPATLSSLAASTRPLVRKRRLTTDVGGPLAPSSSNSSASPHLSLDVSLAERKEIRERERLRSAKTRLTLMDDDDGAESPTTSPERPRRKRSSLDWTEDELDDEDGPGARLDGGLWGTKSGGANSGSGVSSASARRRMALDAAGVRASASMEQSSTFLISAPSTTARKRKAGSGFGTGMSLGGPRAMYGFGDDEDAEGDVDDPNDDDFRLPTGVVGKRKSSSVGTGSSRLGSKR